MLINLQISKLGDLFHRPVCSHLQQQSVGAVSAPRHGGQRKLNGDLIHGGAGGRGDGLLSPPPPGLFSRGYGLFVAHLDLLPVHRLA